ncbi:GNAT family N-acetyltransferase [Halobacillus yeomjeoni]|uniref:GNAT family N-acetyltransferase n=1 Tax=Halobacillus yeomjeoni TaxID=311194 RepID=UPI001CD6FB2C|nr:GNAT family N-acetyltransferase [Halobacillus yeomjeoni]MCA0983930.1 GNAT family N-acetyltransferase [Halobacillus yeomjeoni]
MQTRELTGKDAESYYELRLEALLNNPDSFITTYEQEKQKPDPIKTTAERLDSHTSRTFGLFEDEKLCGVVTLVKETHPKFAHKATIVAMYVTPECRRKSGAATLLQSLINFARGINLEVLHLSVVTENQPARALYEQAGFRPYGLERKAIKLPGRYLDEEHMELFL